jgi:hypothetical protein
LASRAWHSAGDFNDGPLCCAALGFSSPCHTWGRPYQGYDSAGAFTVGSGLITNVSIILFAG